MSFQSMQAELRGSVPKLDPSYAGTLINRAWRTVRERNLWSFLLFEGQWVAPPVANTGTVTVVQGTATATLDSTAKTALNTALAAQPYSLITQRQFRIGFSGIYNIWSYDSTSGVLSLDRPFGEASASGAAYQIYQCYYVPQANSGATPTYLSDFKGWISVRNIQNFIDLYTDRYTRAQLDEIDPQRMSYFFPTDVVPYVPDTNPASATYRYPRFELWGGPLSNYIYQLYGMRRGLDLALPTDTLPPPVGEDCVLALARVYAYEWAEANKQLAPRAVGPDFRFLMGAARTEYESLLRIYRQADREYVDNWFSVRRDALYGKSLAYYNSLSGTAYPGVVR